MYLVISYDNQHIESCFTMQEAKDWVDDFQKEEAPTMGFRITEIVQDCKPVELFSTAWLED